MSPGRRLDVRGQQPEDVELAPVIGHLREGGLLAYPTETVYGFGSLVQEGPVGRLRELKRRTGEKPLLLLVPGPEAVPTLRWTDEARELADVFWPGAVTLVLADPDETYPPGVRGPDGTVAVRQTSHPLAGRLADELGEPLTSTSANVPGEPAASTGEAARDAARGVGAGPDMWILDAGALAPSDPSTIVDCSVSPPRVLRPGATPVSRLRCALPEIHDASSE